jgi:cytochrome oxidase Cu insertion factor (SCO1/SenC/PrrC family)
MEAGGDALPAMRRRLPRRQLAGVLALAVLIGLVAAVATHRLASSPAPPKDAVSRSALRGEATWAVGARPAPAITALRDQTGHHFSLASLRGHTVAIEFWDSHCTQECPLAGRALAAAERSLPRAQRPVLVVVSVNPRDTPASTRGAIRRWNLAGAGPWHWLMGTHARLASVWRAYGIAVIPTKTDIVHTEALYLIDRHGDERSAYLFPYMPGFVAHDMRTLAGPPEPGGRRV